jgi:hypothetical protein
MWREKNWIEFERCLNNATTKSVIYGKHSNYVEVIKVDHEKVVREEIGYI